MYRPTEISLNKNVEIREYLNVQHRAGSKILIKIQHSSSILFDGTHRCDFFLLLPVSNSGFLR